MERDYIIAGLRVHMDTFGRTLKQAEPYATQTRGEADIIVSSRPQQLQEKYPDLSIDDCEYVSTGSNFYTQLLCFDGMMIHASAVAMDGYAYLFSAPCGTGKSTHAQMWQEVFGHDRVVILNDDKPAIRYEDGHWYAYGTPWSGKTDHNLNSRVPLGGICILERGHTNEIKPFSGVPAVLAILEQTVRPRVASSREKILELLDLLLQAVPLWKLSCTPTKEAAIVSHAAMYREAKRRL